MESSEADALTESLRSHQVQLQNEAKELVEQLSVAPKPLQRHDVQYIHLVGAGTTTHEHYVPIQQLQGSRTSLSEAIGTLVKLTPAMSLAEREALFPSSYASPEVDRDTQQAIEEEASASIPSLTPVLASTATKERKEESSLSSNPSPSPRADKDAKIAVSPIHRGAASARNPTPLPLPLPLGLPLGLPEPFAFVPVLSEHMTRLGEWADEAVSIRPTTNPTPRSSEHIGGGSTTSGTLLKKKQSFRFDVEATDDSSKGAHARGTGASAADHLDAEEQPKSILVKKVPSFKFPPSSSTHAVGKTSENSTKACPSPSPPKGPPPKSNPLPLPLPLTVDIFPPPLVVPAPVGGGGGLIRPISREDVQRMVIPTFGQIHMSGPNSPLGRGTSPNGLLRGISRGAVLSRGGAFPVLLEMSDVIEEYITTNDGLVEGLGDLSQHNFISNVNPVTGSAQQTDMTKLESTDGIFIDRPGTHERPNTTQLRYMDLYRDGLRLQTPKAAAMSLEHLFDKDLEFSHRSVQSDITTNEEDDFSIGAKNSVRLKNKAARNELKPLKSSAEPALPFHFPVTKPTMPHVDTGISNPQMHFDKIKAKYLSQEEVFLLNKKVQYLKKAKDKKRASRRELMGRMRRKGVEDSLMAEFSHEQINSAMEYFQLMCVGLSGPSKAFGDISLGSNIDAVTDEIKLNELEAVIRKYRRAQVTKDEEAAGRGLLISLEWLLNQLGISPMTWFELTDSTRANNPKLATEEASSRLAGLTSNVTGMGLGQADTNKTKGNGKLSYIELVFGIDMLCEKLTEKLTALAIKEQQQATHLSRFRENCFDEDSDNDSGSKGSSPVNMRSLNNSPVMGAPGGVADDPKVQMLKKKKKKKTREESITKVVVPYWKRADIHVLLKYLDPNGDGDISTEELQLAFRNLHGTLQSERLMQEAGPIVSRLVDYLKVSRLKVKDLFRLIDTDRSGTISSEELFEAMKLMPSFNKADTDEQSLDSLGSISLDTLGSSGIASNSIAASSFAGMSQSDKSFSTDFRSPFKYVPGSRALLGARAFGKLNQDVTTTRMYDIEKMNAKTEHRERSRSRSPNRTADRRLSHSPSPEPGESGTTYHAASKSMPSLQPRSMLVNPLTPKVTFMATRNSAANNASRRNSMAKVGIQENRLALQKKTAKRAVALDPGHRVRIDHYSSVWEKQLKKLEMPQQRVIITKEI